RTPLKISVEIEYPLSTLALPEKMGFESMLKNPAIQLFVSCAQKVNKGFMLTSDNSQSVAGICRRMDGLPLAMELAAARLRILTAEQLFNRLGRALDLLTTGPKDAPYRHQTLRATIDWSYKLLKEKERQLFRRLSVFSRGFTIEAVEEVCYDNEESSINAIDEIESLMDKGLLEKMGEEGRFNLLQTIKDFALEKLVSAQEYEQFFYKHALYFSSFSEILARGTEGERQKQRMILGLSEEANIAAAMDYLVFQAEKGNSSARDVGLNICGNLWMYWHIRGKHSSTKENILSLLDGAKDDKPSLAKCRALFCLHVSTFTLGEIDSSREVASRLLILAKKLEDEFEIARGLFGLAFGNMMSEISLSLKYSEEAVDQLRKGSHQYMLGFALWQNGLLKLISGSLENAEESYAEALSIFEKLGDEEGKGCAKSGISMLEFIRGNYRRAIELYLQTLISFKTIGDRPEEARILYEISWAYLAIGDTHTALNHILESIQAHQEVGSTRGIGLSLNGLAAVQAVMGIPDKAVEIAAAAQQFAKMKGVAIEFGVSNHGKIYLDEARKKLSSMDIKNAEYKGSSSSLEAVLKMIKDDFTDTKDSAVKSSESGFIQKLNDTMEENYEDANFGVNELYEAVAMSQMQVYRKLKLLVGKTPSQFIREYRLKKAEALLKQTDKTIAEIAYEVGFTDPNYFSRVFQKPYLQSPSDYRR
ncbi:MAG: helix-turn-helix domain-containing protein, partial [Saprospiraceae bacterium]|nr:helix-turn-helix domain-containing protein [Saprospiraceae bacterium]